MRLTLATPAVVLRTWPYGESDRIVRCLTESHGKVTGIAKGAKRSKKRFVNSLEPFSAITLRFYDRTEDGLVFILSADLRFVFKRLSASLEKITLASYIVEITDGLLGDRDEHAKVFHHLQNALICLDSRAPDPLEFLARYELQLLRMTGYQPLLDSCRICMVQRAGTDGARWYFSPSEGGVVCSRCAQSRRELLNLSGTALSAMTCLQSENAPEFMDSGLTRAILTEMRFAIHCFLQYRLDREVKSAAFLSKFIGM